MRARFIEAIHNKQKIIVTFNSKDDNSTITRKCAPMDFGPSRRAKLKNDRFHFWDFESDKQNHTLSLNPDQIIKMEILNEVFDPGCFITWETSNSPWFIERDWGNYS